MIKDYRDMSSRELRQERTRLIDELIGKGAPTDAFERAAVLDTLKANRDNPLVRRLDQIDEEQLRQAPCPK